MAAVSILQKAQNYTAYRGEKIYAWAILLKDKILKGKTLKQSLKIGVKLWMAPKAPKIFFIRAEGAEENFHLAPKAPENFFLWHQRWDSEGQSSAEGNRTCQMERKKKVALKAPKSMPIAPKTPKIFFLYHGAEGAKAKMGLYIGKRQEPLKIGGKTLKPPLKMG